MAAEFIAASTYAGTWTRLGIPTGHRADTYTAGELAALNTDEFAIWESAGHMQDGRELFCRSRYVPQSDGSLNGYDSDGRRIIVHPATRGLRLLTK